jgi:hypothetical protein
MIGFLGCGIWNKDATFGYSFAVNTADYNPIL